MDCHFHSAVPSIATCRECARTICATCRDGAGFCPSCRLAHKIERAAAPRDRLAGDVGPSSPPPPRPEPQPSPHTRTWATAPAAAPAVATVPAIAVETRALVALGYPFWPLAALALLGARRSPWVRRQASQALGFNLGSFALWAVLTTVAHIPLIGLSAWPLLALYFPVWMIACVVFTMKAWHGDEVRVPLVSEWLDDHDQRSAAA